MKIPKPTFPYRYTGPDTNLGRHGFVRSGDIVQLDADEIVSLQGDSRFSIVTAEDTGNAELTSAIPVRAEAQAEPLEAVSPLPPKAKKRV